MQRFCEKLINTFNRIFFGEEVEKEETEEKVEYTLSSVFPSKEIMMEAKKYL